MKRQEKCMDEKRLLNSKFTTKVLFLKRETLINSFENENDVIAIKIRVRKFFFASSDEFITLFLFSNLIFHMMPCVINFLFVTSRPLILIFGSHIYRLQGCIHVTIG